MSTSIILQPTQKDILCNLEALLAVQQACLLVNKSIQRIKRIEDHRTTKRRVVCCISLRYYGAILPKIGDPLPPIRYNPTDGQQYNHDGRQYNFEFFKHNVPRSVLDKVALQEDVEHTGFFMYTLGKEVVYPLMFGLGPFRCNGQSGCDKPAESFCCTPMSSLHRDPPSILDPCAVPVCLDRQCCLEAMQLIEQFIGPHVSKKRIRDCRNCHNREEDCNQKNGYKVCSRCKVTYYCSRECQLEDWPNHKKICKKFDE